MSEDPWDSAPAGGDYTSADDLGEGAPNRLCLIYPKSVGQGKGNNGAYDYVQTVVLPIDGPTSEKVPAVGVDAATNPIEMRFNGTIAVGSLKKQIAANKQAGKIRPILCRLDGKPSTQNKKVTVWAFNGAVSDADKALARPVYDAYEAQEVDPFAAP
jgi:hypothetical protein